MPNVTNEEIRDKVLILSVTMDSFSSQVSESFSRMEKTIREMCQRITNLEQTSVHRSDIDPICERLTKIESAESASKTNVVRLETVNGHQEVTLSDLTGKMETQRLAQVELVTKLGILMKILVALAIPILGIAITLGYNLLTGTQVVIAP